MWGDDAGEYWNWSMLCKGHRAVEKVTYVGGLDSTGAPHGMGAWHDTHKDGELLIGCAARPLACHLARKLH